MFDGPDRLILDGDTEFDFNLDGTSEPATAHFDLRRRYARSQLVPRGTAHSHRRATICFTWNRAMLEENSLS